MQSHRVTELLSPSRVTYTTSNNGRKDAFWEKREINETPEVKKKSAGLYNYRNDVLFIKVCLLEDLQCGELIGKLR